MKEPEEPGADKAAEITVSEDGSKSSSHDTEAPSGGSTDQQLQVEEAKDVVEHMEQKSEPPPINVDIPDRIPVVDKAALDGLTYGVLAHFLPELQKAKSTLAELTENQRILIETVQQENAKFGECQELTEVTEVMEKAKRYHAKLINIKKEMTILHEKSGKLKKRSLKLQQQKQKEALQREQEREREAEKERRLTAKLAKPTAGIT